MPRAAASASVPTRRSPATDTVSGSGAGAASWAPAGAMASSAAVQAATSAAGKASMLFTSPPSVSRPAAAPRARRLGPALHPRRRCRPAEGRLPTWPPPRWRCRCRRTLVAVRPMSRNWSMPMISSSPASGRPNIGSDRGHHHQRGTRHAGDALARHHQDQQHGDLRAERHLDAERLGHEDGGERLVHHRAVEVERVAQRQHEAGDALAHAVRAQLLHHLRIGRLAAGGGKGDQHRFTQQPQQPDHRATPRNTPPMTASTSHSTASPR